jgi:Putative Flp pilus-assembly TadE/G-like
MSKQRGFTTVMVAVSILTIFALAAIAVDLGVLYTARTSAQHAADAAALAGAYTFGPGVIQPDAAVNAATTVAARNKIMGQPVVITAANINVDEPNRRVTVTVPRTGANGIETFFAKVIGWNTVDVQTVATAEAAAEGSAARCIKPVFIPNTILAPDPTIKEACDNGHVIFNPGTLKFSDWFNAYATTLWGRQMDIRPSNPQDSLEPGQFYSLDFGSGGSTYRCAWGQCLDQCGAVDEIACGHPYPLKTGDMVGPTHQGVDDLIGDSPDIFGGRDSATKQYWFYAGGNDGPKVYTSNSVTVAPVWDNCRESISPGYHGQTVTVAGFMTMFVKGFNNSHHGTVQAYFMDTAECPTNGGGTGGGGAAGNPATGPYGVPVRLVQTTTTTP